MYTVLTVKTNKELKEAAQSVAKELGIPLSTAVNAFLKQFVRDRKLELSDTLTPSPYLERCIKEAEEEFKAGKCHGPFHTVEEVMADLES
jgi:DNA-damage-inducible protein J